MKNEAVEIMRMDPSDGLALAEKAKGGAPADVRKYVLYSAWRNLQADRFIPTKKKPHIFQAICTNIAVEVIHG
jgi:hypothetical protein